MHSIMIQHIIRTKLAPHRGNLPLVYNIATTFHQKHCNHFHKINCDLFLATLGIKSRPV